MMVFFFLFFFLFFPFLFNNNFFWFSFQIYYSKYFETKEHETEKKNIEEEKPKENSTHPSDIEMNLDDIPFDLQTTQMTGNNVNENSNSNSNSNSNVNQKQNQNEFENENENENGKDFDLQSLRDIALHYNVPQNLLKQLPVKVVDDEDEDGDTKNDESKNFDYWAASVSQNSKSFDFKEWCGQLKDNKFSNIIISSRNL